MDARTTNDAFDSIATNEVADDVGANDNTRSGETFDAASGGGAFIAVGSTVAFNAEDAVVTYNATDGVAHIAINSPETLNAATPQINQGLINAFKLAARDAMVRTVVLSGNGRAFCAGGNLDYFYGQVNTPGWSGYADAHQASGIPEAMRRCPKPVVAAVHGAAAGSGLVIAAAADFCIAEEGTRFAPAFTGVGLIPDTGGMYVLAQVVGWRQAMRLALSGEPFDAHEALRLGLASAVAAEGQALQEAMKLATRLAQGPSNVYAHLKQMDWDANWGDAYERYRKHEAQVFAECANHPNFREGIEAFLKRRPAEFQ